MLVLATVLQTALAAPPSRRPLSDSAAALDRATTARSPLELRQAQLELARALHALGLPVAARIQLRAAVEGAIDTPAARQLTERALVALLAQEPVLSDPALIAAAATLPADPLHPRLQPAVHTLHGLGALADGETQRAAAALALAHTPQAELVQALLAQDRGAPRTAARHLLRAREQAADPRRPDPALHDLATLDLARLMHAHARWRTAEELYLSLDTQSPDWARAREELAWTYLLAGNRSRALGTALSLWSPLGQAELEPSAELVVGIARAEACHWDAAAATAERLAAELQPVVARIEHWRVQDHAQRAWADPALPTGLRRAARRDALLAEALGTIVQIEHERELLASQRADWAETVGATIDRSLLEERARLDALADTRSRLVLDREHARLQGIIDDAQVLAFEIGEGQRQDLEVLARTAAAPPPAPDVDWAVSTDFVAWPFNGEFWEDELDSYSAELAGSCLTES